MLDDFFCCPCRPCTCQSTDCCALPCAQLNGGVLIFLLLCIACAAVWLRLLLLWCTFRTTSCCRGGGAFGRRRRCRRFGPTAALATHDDIKEGLEAPLLNPLQHEAPITSAVVCLYIACVSAWSC